MKCQTKETGERNGEEEEGRGKRKESKEVRKQERGE